MKKVFHFFITKFKRIKYLVILLLALAVIYLGFPGASTALALVAGSIECNPMLVGLSISIGGGIASTLSQYTGQLFFDESKLLKIEIALKDFTEQNEKYVIPVLMLSSVSFIPETYLFSTIGKDVPKLKMFLINLVTRFFNFWLISWLGKNYLVILFKKIKNVFKKK